MRRGGTTVAPYLQLLARRLADSLLAGHERSEHVDHGRRHRRILWKAAEKSEEALHTAAHRLWHYAKGDSDDSLLYGSLLELVRGSG